MPRLIRLAVVLALLVPIVLAVGSRPAASEAPSLLPGMPPEIVSIRNHWLEKPDYRDLAAAWREFLEEHPESAVAEVQLGRALRYAGEPAEEVRRHYARALEIGPDSPEALDTAASTFLGEWEPLADGAAGCYALGLKAVARAPGWAEPHFTLWPLALALGKAAESERHLTDLVHKGGIPAPVLDYCYNMLEGAETGAIIFTNGDNDTYGCRALQAAFGLRPDVQVLNLSLINHPEIEATIFDHFAGNEAPLSPSEREEMRRDFMANYVRDRELYSTKLMKAVTARAASGAWPGPVYMALTISSQTLETCDQPRRIEGLLWRVLTAEEGERPDPGREAGSAVDPPVDITRTYELFSARYRLESATDFAFNWRENNSVLRLMDNYHAVLFKLAFAAAGAGDMETMRFAFARGLEIAAFHDRAETIATMAGYWQELDPRNPDVENWTTRGD